MARRGRKPRTRASWGGVRVLASGNYQASYRHGGIPGVQPSVVYKAPVTFQTEGDARVWLETERRLIETGQWTPPAEREAAKRKAERHTVGTFGRQWLDHAELRPSTRTRYENLWRTFILGEPLQNRRERVVITSHGLGGVYLDQLDRTQVTTWWRSLPTGDRRRSCDLAYNLLKTVMLAAVDDGLIETSPVRVRTAGKPSQRRSVEPMTPAQVKAVADAMPERWQLGVLLGAWCSLRSGEVRELRRKDVDVTAGVIRVTRGVTRGSGKLTVGAPKTDAGVRTVRIPASVLTAVKAHLRDHAQIGSDGLLFWREDGGQVTDSDWWRAWRKACADAGVQGVRFHDLRHVGLTYTAVAGATIRELQAIAGHTTPAMAMRYQEVAADHLAEVVAGLDAIITSGKA